MVARRVLRLGTFLLVASCSLRNEILFDPVIHRANERQGPTVMFLVPILPLNKKFLNSQRYYSTEPVPQGLAAVRSRSP